MQGQHVERRLHEKNWQPHEFYTGVTACLHDAGATLAPERVHSGSLSLPCIRLHDTPNCLQTDMPVRVTPALVHPSRYTGARISFRCEISRCHSCKRTQNHEGIEVNSHPVIWWPLYHVNTLFKKENAMLWLWSCGLFSVLFVFRKFQG